MSEYWSPGGQAMTKKVPDRNQAVLHGFTFLQAYQGRRAIAQESAYNMGRAAHELNLLHVAVPFYEQALRCAPPAAQGTRKSHRTLYLLIYLDPVYEDPESRH